MATAVPMTPRARPRSIAPISAAPLAGARSPATAVTAASSALPANDVPAADEAACHGVVRAVTFAGSGDLAGGEDAILQQTGDDVLGKPGAGIRRGAQMTGEGTPGLPDRLPARRVRELKEVIELRHAI